MYDLKTKQVNLDSYNAVITSQLSINKIKHQKCVFAFKTLKTPLVSSFSSLSDFLNNNLYIFHPLCHHLLSFVTLRTWYIMYYKIYCRNKCIANTHIHIHVFLVLPAVSLPQVQGLCRTFSFWSFRDLECSISWFQNLTTVSPLHRNKFYSKSMLVSPGCLQVQQS